MSKYAVNNDVKNPYRELPGSRHNVSEKIDNDIVNSTEIVPVIMINKECPICFDEIYSTDEYIVFDICNHSYHLKCLNQWKCQCNSASTVYKCELCQEFRDIKEFNQKDAEIVEKPKRTNWFKKCIKKIFG